MDWVIVCGFGRKTVGMDRRKGCRGKSRRLLFSKWHQTAITGFTIYWNPNGRLLILWLLEENLSLKYRSFTGHATLFFFPFFFFQIISEPFLNWERGVLNTCCQKESSFCLYKIALFWHNNIWHRDILRFCSNIASLPMWKLFQKVPCFG